MKRLISIILLLLSSLTLNAQRCIVLDFQIGTNVTEEDVESISYEFRSTFNPSCYRVLDHERVMKKVAELGFNPGKMTAENIRKVGRNMDAVIVVYGILDKYMGEYSLDVSVMDISSGTTALNQNTTFQQSEYRTHPRSVSKEMENKLCDNLSTENNDSKNYIDLGLPSGTKWKKYNEEGLYTYYEASEKFDVGIPTIEEWEELKEKCKWSWIGNGYNITGPNGNHISINLTKNEYGGKYGAYWSCTPAGEFQSCYVIESILEPIIARASCCFTLDELTVRLVKK